MKSRKKNKQLSYTKSRLIESEERYRRLFESARDGIFLLDFETGKITDSNPFMSELLGYGKDAFIGKYLWEIGFYKDALEAKKDFLKLQTNSYIRYKDLPLERKDGKKAPVEFISNVYLCGGKKVIQCNIRDISERKTAEVDHNTMQAQLLQSQKMETVGRLAGGVAHDFNNLLTAIICYGGFLLKGLAADDPKRGDVKEILAAADRAAALTMQLLTFSRKQILSPKIVDLNASVGDTVKMLKRLLGEGVKLETRLAARICQVKVDPGQMDQMIVNLAVNARDAMPKGGALVLETAILTPETAFFSKHPELPRGPLVCLSISDTGVGIADNVKEHLFEPFFTTKEKGKGTGLGLAMVFGIVKQSGGEIEVESEVGRGTTFKIYLPYIEAVTRDKVQEKDKSLEGLPKGSETILLVEDEDSLRRLGERLLRMNGYTVIVAASGKEALEAIERHGKPVDLLMTDVVMPGMSGRELALELARKKLAYKTLYMSGYTDDAIVQHGVLEPGIAFIYKPFSVESLSLKLREVLDGPDDKAKA